MGVKHPAVVGAVLGAIGGLAVGIFVGYKWAAYDYDLQFADMLSKHNKTLDEHTKFVEEEAERKVAKAEEEAKKTTEDETTPQTGSQSLSGVLPLGVDEDLLEMERLYPMEPVKMTPNGDILDDEDSDEDEFEDELDDPLYLEIYKE